MLELPGVKVPVIPELDESVSRLFRRLLRSQLKTLKESGHLREGLAAFAALLQEELTHPDVEKYYSRSIAYPGATEYLARVLIASIEGPASVNYMVGKATTGYQCLKSWSESDRARVYSMPIWKTIDTDTHHDFDALCAEIATTRHRFHADDVREEARNFFAPRPHYGLMRLVVITPEELGLGGNSQYGVICRAAEEYGLHECATDTPLQLMRQYKSSESVGQTLFIATRPTARYMIFRMSWENDPNSGELSLCSIGHGFSAKTRFLFHHEAPWDPEV